MYILFNINLLSLLLLSCISRKSVRLTRRRTILTLLSRSSQFENEIGALPPLGYWDPLGFLVDADQERFDRLRYVEMKHGRISMLAILGHLVTTYGIRIDSNLPGHDNISFKDIPNGIAALEKLPQDSLIELIALIALLEVGFSLRQEDIEEAQLRASGWDEGEIDIKISKELNNGRAAQIGILALMVHEKLDNNPYVINSLFGLPVKFNEVIIEQIPENLL